MHARDGLPLLFTYATACPSALPAQHFGTDDARAHEPRSTALLDDGLPGRVECVRKVVRGDVFVQREAVGFNLEA